MAGLAGMSTLRVTIPRAANWSIQGYATRDAKASSSARIFAMSPLADVSVSAIWASSRSRARVESGMPRCRVGDQRPQEAGSGCALWSSGSSRSVIALASMPRLRCMQCHCVELSLWRRCGAGLHTN